VFDALEKAIQQREKGKQSKDLYYQSEDHKHFYSFCKGIPFYKWEYLLSNHEGQHDELAKNTHDMCCWNRLISLPQKERIKDNLSMYEYNHIKELMEGKSRPTGPQKEEAEEK